MRLERLDLVAYGPFTDVSLDLSAPGVHLVVGPNEAGKSMTLAAIGDALFGIPARTTAGFIHALPTLEIGVELRRGDGTRIEFHRLKRNKGDLRRPDGSELPAAELAAFLGAVDRAVFETTYGLDHARLVSGGQDLVAGGGELGEAIYEAASGVTGLHALLQELDDRAGQLFSPRGRNPKLNAAIARRVEAEKAVSEHELRPNTYSELVREIDALEAEQQRARTQRAELARDLDRAKVLLAASGNLRRRRRAIEELDELRPTTPTLRAALGDELDAVVADRELAHRELERLRREADRKQAQIDRLAIDRALLARRSDLDRLREQRAQYVGARDDRPAVAQQAEGEARGAADVLARLRPGATLEDAPAQLVIETTLAQRVRDLAAEEPERRTARDNAATELARATDERDDAQARLDALACPPGDAVLRAGYERVRAAGDLSGELEQARTRLDAIEAEAAELMDQLGLTGVELSGVPDLAVPAGTTVERYRTDLDAAKVEVDRLAQAVAEAEDARERVRGELAELVATADPPTEADLEQRRVERDGLWARLRAAWLSRGRPDGATPHDADVVEVDEAVEVADRYESAVTEADAVADRLRREADAVARRASLQAKDASLQDDIRRDTDQLAARRADHAALEQAWRAEWEPIGLEPGAPSEMNQWLADFAKLRSRAREAARLRDERTRRVTQLDEHRRELLAGLAAAGRATAVADGEEHLSLSTVTDLARRTLEGAEELRRKRETLQGELGRLAATVQERSAAAERAHAAYAAWQAAWDAAMERVDLPHDTTPSEALAFLTDTERLAGHLHAAESSRARLEQIDGYLQDYTERLGAVVADVAPDLADREPLSALDQLVERLDAAVEADTTSRGLATDLEELADQRDQQDAHLADAATRLERLFDEAGVPDEAALRDAIERSDRLHRLADELEGLERAIVEQGDGATAEELEAALAGRDDVALRTEIDELTTRLDELEGRISERDTRLGGLRRDHARLDGSAAAADAATELAFRSAEIERLTKEYVSVALAGELLRHHIATYRDQHQAPILQRAAPWFSKLTCGRFSGLDTDVDDKGVLVLEGVRPNGERVGVEAMSEGTCDQLYLALRLAALAEAADRQEPFPLVLDDVLITFDDDRSRAALEILGELSATYQVLMFTHHDHLRELAVETLGDRVTRHELQPRDLSLPAAAPSAQSRSATVARSGSRGYGAMQHPGAAAAVLEALRTADAPLGRSDLLARAGIPEASWSTTIKALVDRGDVVKLGDRRGARYQLASPCEP